MKTKIENNFECSSEAQVECLQKEINHEVVTSRDPVPLKRGQLVMINSEKLIIHFKCGIKFGQINDLLLVLNKGAEDT
jgi:hypothetical protein